MRLRGLLRALLQQRHCVSQVSGSDCGPAALATVGLCFNRHFSLNQIRLWSGTGRDGTSLYGLAQAAQSMGLRAEGVRANTEALRGLPTPSIAHCRRASADHYLVVFRVTRNGSVVIGDPMDGSVTKISPEAFQATWTGCLLLVAADDRDLTRAPATITPLFRTLLFPDRRLAVVASVLALVSVGCALLPPFYVQILVDRVVLRREFHLLVPLTLGVLLSVGVRGAAQFASEQARALLSQRGETRLQGGFCAALLKLPMVFFRNANIGDIFCRFNDISHVRNVAVDQALRLFQDAVLFLAAIGVMLTCSAKLTALTLLLLPAFAAIAFLFAPHFKAARREIVERGAELSGRLADVAYGIAVIKAFRAEGTVRERFLTAVSRLQDAFLRSNRISAIFGVLTLSIGATGSLLVVATGARLVSAGTLTVGQLVLFFALLGLLLGPLERFTQLVDATQEGIVAAERVAEIYAIPGESDSGGGRPFTLDNSLVFDGVTFRYDDAASALQEVSFCIRPGTRVGIVGASGSGKTTLLNLLLRFGDPSEGRILLDGQDLRSIDVAALREAVGLVPQDCYLLDTTIRDNILLGRREYPDDSVIEAAVRAGLHEFVQELPLGYDTIVGDRGILLSGGERQRIALARAFLAAPRLLLLDEPTSALDSMTESGVLATIDHLLMRTTVLLATHRLSAIWNAGLIVVLHKGRVVECGDRDSLLRNRGPFWDLWRHQTGRLEPQVSGLRGDEPPGPSLWAPGMLV